MALVEIVLPIFNPTGAVYEAIDSVVGQTFTDWHLTIVDDCSPVDIGDDILSRYGSHKQIDYLRLGKNMKAAGARNLIISETKSEFFALQDQDDIWLPEKLERQVVFFSTLPKKVGAVHGDIEIVNTTGQLVPDKARLENEARATTNWSANTVDLQRSVFMASNIRLISSMIRRSSFEDIGGFDSTLTGDEDWEFWVRLSGKYGIRHLPHTLIHRRIHNNNVSKTSGLTRNIGTLDVLKKIQAAGYPISGEMFAEKEYRIYATIIRFVRKNLGFFEAIPHIRRFIYNYPLRFTKHLKLIWYLIFGSRKVF